MLEAVCLGVAIDFGSQYLGNVLGKGDFNPLDVNPVELGLAGASGGVGGLAFDAARVGLAAGGITGIGNSFGAGAISGITAGRFQQVGQNLLTGQDWTNNLFDPTGIVGEGLSGGLFAAGLDWVSGGGEESNGKGIGICGDGSSANSFSANTLVETNAQGQEQAISTLKVGDHVLADNEQSGTTGIFTITAVLVHTDPTLVDLTIDGEQVETTPEHPFYTQEYGWVGAGYLWQGAHIRKADGSFGVVQAVKVVQRQQVMYNLTVEGAHTFFVGDKHWLVHNNNCNFDELGQDTLLSNGQTNREFRQSKDNCFYCGRSLNHLEERPDRRTLGVAKAEELAKAQSITEHIYSKDLARQFGNHLTQDEADQYVRDVDGLVVACRSCNSSKGKKNLLDWKGPKSGWVTGSRETAVSVYNYIKDKYGFTGP